VSNRPTIGLENGSSVASIPAHHVSERTGGRLIEMGIVMRENAGFPKWDNLPCPHVPL
jgi:hypothetical protein